MPSLPAAPPALTPGSGSDHGGGPLQQPRVPAPHAGAVGFGLISTAMAVGGLLGAASYGWLERHVRLGVFMRGGLIIETLTHLALALTRWAWSALMVFVIFGAHAFIWGMARGADPSAR